MVLKKSVNVEIGARIAEPLPTLSRALETARYLYDYIIVGMKIFRTVGDDGIGVAATIMEHRGDGKKKIAVFERDGVHEICEYRER